MGHMSIRLNRVGKKVKHYDSFTRGGHIYRIGSYLWIRRDDRVGRIEDLHACATGVRLTCLWLVHPGHFKQTAMVTTDLVPATESHADERYWNQSRMSPWACTTVSYLSDAKPHPCEVVSFDEYNRRRATGDTSKRLYFVRHEWIPQTRSLGPFDEKLLVQVNPDGNASHQLLINNTKAVASIPICNTIIWCCCIRGGAEYTSC
jgi:hypothetical protein